MPSILMPIAISMCSNWVAGSTNPHENKRMNHIIYLGAQLQVKTGKSSILNVWPSRDLYNIVCCTVLAFIWILQVF